jgi:hypothetical protein
MTGQTPVIDRSFGRAFGAGLALALLAIYTTAAMVMILAILEACPDTPDCATLSDRFGHGYIYVLTTVGGLVSALVVGQLGAAHPGELPGAAQRAGQSRLRRIASGTVIAIYLIVWAGVGFASLIVGVMLYPDAISTVSDMGTVWLGLAVSAGYAYFGIDTQR